MIVVLSVVLISGMQRSQSGWMGGILNGCRHTLADLQHFVSQDRILENLGGGGGGGGAATLPFWFLCPRRSAHLG